MGRMKIRLHEFWKRTFSTQRGIGRDLYAISEDLDDIYEKKFPADKDDVVQAMQIGSVAKVEEGYEHFAEHFGVFEQEDGEVFSDVHILERIITNNLGEVAKAVEQLEGALKGNPAALKILQNALAELLEAASTLDNEILSEVSSQRMDYFGFNFMQEHNLTTHGRIFHYLEKYARIAKVSITHVKAMTKALLSDANNATGAAKGGDQKKLMAALDDFMKSAQGFKQYVLQEVEAFKTLVKHAILANVLAEHVEKDMDNMKAELLKEGYPDDKMKEINEMLGEAHAKDKSEKYEYRVGKRIESTLRSVESTLKKAEKFAKAS